MNVHGVVSTPRRPMYSSYGTFFPAHWSERALAAGLASGTILRGRYSQKFASSGIVLGAGSGPLAKISLRGRNRINRAVHGDSVAVLVDPPELWDERPANPVNPWADDGLSEAGLVAAGSSAGGIATVADGRPLLHDAPHTMPLVSSWGDAAAATDAGVAKGDTELETPPETVPVPTGVVVGIIERSGRPFTVVFDHVAIPMKSDHLVVPRRSGMPKFRVLRNEVWLASHGSPARVSPRPLLSHGVPSPHRQVHEPLVKQMLYTATVKSWGQMHRFPTALVERTLGPAGDPNAETEAILVDLAVHTGPFAKAAVDALPPPGWTPSAEEVARRTDLREGPTGNAICSVDPPGAVDIDDALHAIELSRAADGSRRFEVGVHIADVGHFIKHGDLLDDEVTQRGTTFYLVDRRVNMVPEVLGEDVSSLHPHVDRLAFSVLWEMDEQAAIISSRIEKTLIRSRRAFTYAEAQAAINRANTGDCEANTGGEASSAAAGVGAEVDDDGQLTRSLSTLSALARRLHEARVAKGALRLASPEVKFALEEDGSGDAKGMLPADMSVYLPLDTNSMVEEFMLLANVEVAKVGRVHLLHRGRPNADSLSLRSGHPLVHR